MSDPTTLEQSTLDKASNAPKEEDLPTPISPEEAAASMQQSAAVLRQVELTALAIGALMAAGSWLVHAPNSARLAVLVGAAFSSVNLRLLIWSWSWLFHSKNPGAAAKEQSGKSSIPRFIFKYFFLLVGLGLALGGLKLHVVGFMIGLGNVIIAVALAPTMVQTIQPSQSES